MSAPAFVWAEERETPPVWMKELCAVGYCCKEMANLEHLTALQDDIDEWNQWRSLNPGLSVDLSKADLRGVSLVMADLTHAILRDADLSVADLTGADLRYADLRGANLVGARLIGTDLAGCDLRGTDLRTAEDLTAEQLDETLGDEETVLPREMERPQRWRSESAAR